MTEFGFIGWCKKDNHDKIWGYFLRPTPESVNKHYISKQYGWNCCVFWGRRGKSLQFKADTTGYQLQKLTSAKCNKDYVSITEHKLYKIWPSFTEEMESKLMMDVLSGKIK